MLVRWCHPSEKVVPYGGQIAPLVNPVAAVLVIVLLLMVTIVCSNRCHRPPTCNMPSKNKFQGSQQHPMVTVPDAIMTGYLKDAVSYTCNQQDMTLPVLWTHVVKDYISFIRHDKYNTTTFSIRQFLPKHSPDRFLVMRIDQQHRQLHTSLPLPSTRRHYPSPPAIICTDLVIPIYGKRIMTWDVSIASRNSLYDSWYIS